jgi:tRNA dimethylallyltransferase
LHAGVPHHLLDVAEPSEYFSVADFKKLADAATADITQRNKLPICVGGTGQYIQAIVDNVVPPEVPPDKTLRRELAGKSAEELFDELKRLDPARAKTIERDNPRRLIRAIEVARALGGVPETDISFPANYDKSPYDALQIGLDVPIETLTTHIHERVQSRLNNGWQQEVQNLLRHGITPEQLGEFGLGYSIIAGHITNSVSMEKLVEEITAVERRYAKRQLRWFKRDPRIQWFNPNKTTEITTTVQKFLRS